MVIANEYEEMFKDVCRFLVGEWEDTLPPQLTPKYLSALDIQNESLGLVNLGPD